MEHFVRHECCHGPTNLMITRLSTLATTIEAITIKKNDTQSYTVFVLCTLGRLLLWPVHHNCLPQDREGWRWNGSERALQLGRQGRPVGRVGWKLKWVSPSNRPHLRVHSRLLLRPGFSSRMTYFPAHQTNITQLGSIVVAWIWIFFFLNNYFMKVAVAHLLLACVAHHRNSTGTGSHLLLVGRT